MFFFIELAVQLPNNVVVYNHSKSRREGIWNSEMLVISARHHMLFLAAVSILWSSRAESVMSTLCQSTRVPLRFSPFWFQILPQCMISGPLCRPAQLSCDLWPFVCIQHCAFSGSLCSFSIASRGGKLCAGVPSRVDWPHVELVWEQRGDFPQTAGTVWLSLTSE